MLSACIRKTPNSYYFFLLTFSGELNDQDAAKLEIKVIRYVSFCFMWILYIVLRYSITVAH